jgi:hypothetical protein
MEIVLLSPWPSSADARRSCGLRRPRDTTIAEARRRGAKQPYADQTVGARWVSVGRAFARGQEGEPGVNKPTPRSPGGFC